MAPRNLSADTDTDADIELRKILADPEVSGFTMIAGAGSGKTTSLIKALQHVIASRGSQLLANRQQVACITYTEIARQEIEDDLAANPIADVSTIHSFLWTLVEPFRHDIRRWLEEHGTTDLAELEDKYANLGPRTHDKTRLELKQKIDRRRDGLSRMDAVEKFQMGVGTSYGKGIVGYADVLKLVPELIQSKPLFAKLISRRYPLVFVDESQDTTKAVVDSLRHIAVDQKGHFCVGFFGDPVQKIYGTGIGQIVLEKGWKEVQKPENFRSPRRVLEIINAIRANADELVQTSGLPAEKQRDGEVTCFVLPTSANRRELLDKVQAWLKENSSTGAWRGDAAETTKVLVITHRMAASRLGFEALYSTFHSTRLQESFTEGKAWPLTPFLSTLLPLVEAANSNRPALLPRLRKSSPLLRPENVDETTVRATFATLATGVQELVAVMADGGPASVRRALAVAHDHRLLDLDERLVQLLPDDLPDPDDEADEDDRLLAALMKCDVAELKGYSSYISNESPYSTQQGVKGAEYPNVIVVLDDEARHPSFSYDKYLGLKELSKSEAAKGADTETSIDRTRRLFYVCASRATNALAIVLYAADINGAVHALTKTLPGVNHVVTAGMLSSSGLD
jgi:ATP-dependent DNA helicase UvrD/PcrA